MKANIAGDARDLHPALAEVGPERLAEVAGGYDVDFRCGNTVIFPIPPRPTLAQAAQTLTLPAAAAGGMLVR
jgi:hypothetical protein